MVIIERSVSCGVPVAVFFLTVDRSLILGLGPGYRTQHQVSVFTATYVAAGLIIAVSAFLYVKHFSPVDSRSGAGMEGKYGVNELILSVGFRLLEVDMFLSIPRRLSVPRTDRFRRCQRYLFVSILCASSQI